MTSSPLIVDDSLSGPTSELVRAAAKRFQWDTVHVRPLSRFGYSGAKIFVIRPDYDPHVPHVLKVANLGQIDREKRSINAFKGNIRGMPDTHRFRARTRLDGKAWGAICYEYFADDSQPVDLTDVYANCMGQRDPLVLEEFATRLQPMVKGALDKLKTAHVAHPDQREVTYRSMFKWYLRRKRPSRVDHVIKGGGSFDFCGIRVDGDPLAGLNFLLSQKTNGFQAVVIHGDLHLSNIVVDGTFSPNLIDFAWARRRGHRFLDYALLESSMRFMSFPHDVHPGAVLAVDREFNTDCDASDLGRVLAAVNHPLSRHRLTQMSEAVRFVRGELKAAIGTWTNEAWAEYQRTLYLLLSGQQRLESFPLIRSIINLDQLSKELEL